MHKFETKKYLYVLAITSLIFFTAIYFSNYFNDKKLAEVKSIEDKIAIDILSSETQYALLQESSCKDIGNKALSQELGNLSDKLSYAEEQFESDNTEVINLKRYYSLLEIKDYLLNKRISEKCGKKAYFIIYIYSNAGDCPDCTEEGYVLTYLREKYPDLRVYSFDKNLDLSAVKTLLSIFKIDGELPAIILDEKAYYGLRGKEELESLLPKAIRDSAKKATTTPLLSS
ncbi:MAG: hypothetical protein A2648_00635 [Candidatus Lloydbacteria bacterium RIFCSPHIGHO2_01_FULL_41_20]|uniref:Thioredoxin domain-containing protein n=1 Tax=Candidatus Lloydbacteria bacterium RIFCSPHIGHO2_01_FULL_41_20 TaxID=1798657 RepID=A0A1G2CV31_9BACT|nr:MAG: hypothetical protein A2648_00635 [Candidatus Lloydbacteria bacterium RIFCSPHIGHO2_01_FULL_41_20]